MFCRIEISHEQRKISTDNQYFMSKINDWHVIILYLKFSFVLILFQFQFQFYNFCEKKQPEIDLL